MQNKSEETLDRAPLTRLASGLRQRTWATARLTTRVGLKALAATVLPGSSDRAPAARDEGEAVAAATRLVEQLDQLKGLMMKAGQMASYLDPTLPPAARRVLSTLQSGGQPMAFEAIDEVLRAELGAPAGEAFDRFSPVPFAAASIGQVHRARLGGRELAVKVQYPGVREAISSDLDTLGALARLGTLGTSLDSREIVGTLRAQLLRECDYRAEAGAQRTFARVLAQRWPELRVPEVIDERSTELVLTSTFAPGLGFDRFLERSDQAARDRAAESIFDVCYSMILRHGLYNADPHPGNYLFDEAGGVTFLDFGCVMELSDETIELWKRIALSVRRGDRAAFREAVLEQGTIKRPERFDWEHHWKVLEYIYEPFLTRDFTFTQDYVRRSYDLLLFNNPNARRMTFPGEWVWINRLQWGLNSVLAHLGARADWAELWWSAIEAPLERQQVEISVERG